MEACGSIRYELVGRSWIPSEVTGGRCVKIVINRLTRVDSNLLQSDYQGMTRLD